jgi:hypothetical protein
LIKLKRVNINDHVGEHVLSMIIFMTPVLPITMSLYPFICIFNSMTLGLLFQILQYLHQVNLNRAKTLVYKSLCKALFFFNRGLASNLGSCKIWLIPKVLVCRAVSTANTFIIQNHVQFGF